MKGIQGESKGLSEYKLLHPDEYVDDAPLSLMNEVH